jgi:hypothetical protein
VIDVDYRWPVIILCLLVLSIASKGFDFRIFESIFSSRIFVIGGVERMSNDFNCSEYCAYFVPINIVYRRSIRIIFVSWSSRVL